MLPLRRRRRQPVAGGEEDESDPYYSSLEALEAAHGFIFAEGASLTYMGKEELEYVVLFFSKPPPVCVFAERPIGHRSKGLLEVTLRVRETESEEAFAEHLRQAFVTMYDVFGAGYFEVSITANVILQGTKLVGLVRQPRYYVFYGQDFGEGDYNFSTDQLVRNLGEVRLLPTRFSAENFSRVFKANHESTDVSVHSIISIVFLLRRDLDNYERDKVSQGRCLLTLY